MKQKLSVAPTLKNYDKKNLPKDILAGIIIMAVSIPISMGYAQISGLPAVYGLYGSVFPIILFALFSTSPQFIFGVDAAPAALVGAAVLGMGIEAGSKEAMTVVPVFTFFVALWLLAFYFMNAGKLVLYISAAVMGGFINAAALVMGIVALAILVVSKRLVPKFPMAVVLMVTGALFTYFGPVKEWGVPTLSAVEPGMPRWYIPDFEAVFSVQKASEVIVLSLSVAVVIMAETLLAENNFAQKNGYRIDDNTELLAFSIGNMAAAFTGCCPINGSVSRTAMSEQYEGKTQLTGLVAGVSMIAVLLFCTGFIGYLPVPVLTAIVISALMGATEFHLAKRLWKVSRTEFFIFVGAFFGVLILGTINGVLIGIILSFAEMIIRSAKPATCFLGVQPGHSHFRDIRESTNIHEIDGVIIYRFSSGLFFANAKVLVRDIEDHLKHDTKAVIIDAGAIGSIDITGADSIESLYRSLKQKGVKLYITEHIAELNEQLRKLGLGYLIEQGCVRRTIHIALKDMGINRPYPLEGGVDNEERSASRKRADNRVQEFVWAFGAESEEQIEKQIKLQIEQLKKTKDIEEIMHGRWAHMDEFDQDEWLEHLEEHLKEIVNISGKDVHTLAADIEMHRREVHERIAREHPELAERFAQRRHLLDKHLKERRPEVYRIIVQLREDNKHK